MGKCVYCGLLSKNKERATLHRFPRDVPIRNEWLRLIGLEGLNVGDSTFLCSSHFTKDCFTVFYSNHRRLKLGSMPTILKKEARLQKQQDVSVETNCTESYQQSVQNGRIFDGVLRSIWLLLEIKTVRTLFIGSDSKLKNMASATISPTEDDELTLPRASINKMIKEILPHVRVANESRELILNCCTEFIHLLSSEANEICNQQQKKTINAEHVLQALEKLGFGDYSAEAEAVLRDCKAVAAKRRRQSTRLENLGIPEEELLRQQQELFAKAREEQAVAEQQQWQQLQAVAQMASMQQADSEQEDYS